MKNIKINSVNYQGSNTEGMYVNIPFATAIIAETDGIAMAQRCVSIICDENSLPEGIINKIDSGDTVRYKLSTDDGNEQVSILFEAVPCYWIMRHIFNGGKCYELKYVIAGNIDMTVEKH